MVPISYSFNPKDNEGSKRKFIFRTYSIFIFFVCSDKKENTFEIQIHLLDTRQAGRDLPSALKMTLRLG
jgi:hypothetical protein